MRTSLELLLFNPFTLTSETLTKKRNGEEREREKERKRKRERGRGEGEGKLKKKEKCRAEPRETFEKTE